MKLRLIVFLTVIQCGFINKVKAQNDKKPNIVWIVSEDNSKHYLKLYDKTGAATPNIEKLAETGVVFNHAFSNTPVCSAARSTLIASSYGPRLVTHYHRKIKQVPIPEGQQMFPAYLKEAGYYTTNNSKEDYNIIKADNVWDESFKKATWKNRKKDQPFFHVFNIGTTHESRLHFTKEDVKKGTKTDQSKMFVQPNHPQTDLFKYTVARYHDKIQEMDAQLGAVVDELEKDGLLDETFIFYYGDHGGVLPGSKGYINEMGVHVPLVVHIPAKYKDLVSVKAGTRNDAFVSFVDFGATVLNIAGIDIPKKMDGKPFLGKNVTEKDLKKRDETFSYTNRMDEKYDMVRAVRKGKFKYTRNFEPFNFDALMNNYRYKQLGYQQWIELYKEGKLNKNQSKFFEPKQPEELYNVEEDPYELNNLATHPEYQDIVKSLRNNLNKRMCGLPDLSFYPEFYLINNAFDNPVAFGQAHKKDIKKYIKTANLMLMSFKDAKSKIIKSLNSNDPWVRYWALISASAFGDKAKELSATIKRISKTDSELVNRVRAAEFLGLIKAENPQEVMLNSLYESNDGVEALLILNSIVLMKDCKHQYKFSIDESKVQEKVLAEPQVLRRLTYLK